MEFRDAFPESIVEGKRILREGGRPGQMLFMHTDGGFFMFPDVLPKNDLGFTLELALPSEPCLRLIRDWKTRLLGASKTPEEAYNPSVPIYDVSVLPRGEASCLVDFSRLDHVNNIGGSAVQNESGRSISGVMSWRCGVEEVGEIAVQQNLRFPHIFQDRRRRVWTLQNPQLRLL